MNNDDTHTNFNIQHISYHAKCIEMDIACNNFLKHSFSGVTTKFRILGSIDSN